MNQEMILLLSFLAGSLPLAVLLYLREKMHQQTMEQWMRIFSVHSLAIPKNTMDDDSEEKTKVKKLDTRKRVSFPLPMPDELRAALQSRKTS